MAWPRLAEPGTLTDRVGLDGVALLMYGQGALNFILCVGILILHVATMGAVLYTLPLQAADIVQLVVSELLMVGLMVGMVALFVGPYMLTGWAIRERKPWAHLLGIIMACVSLSNCPIGLIAGGLCLMVLTDKQLVAVLRAGLQDDDRGLSE